MRFTFLLLSVACRFGAAEECADCERPVDATALLQKSQSRGKDEGTLCFKSCEKKRGYCPDFCGAGMVCCRFADPKDPAECRKAEVQAAIKPFLTAKKTMKKHVCTPCGARDGGGDEDAKKPGEGKPPATKEGKPPAKKGKPPAKKPKGKAKGRKPSPNRKGSKGPKRNKKGRKGGKAEDEGSSPVPPPPAASPAKDGKAGKSKDEGSSPAPSPPPVASPAAKATTPGDDEGDDEGDEDEGSVEDGVEDGGDVEDGEEEASCLPENNGCNNKPNSQWARQCCKGLTCVEGVWGKRRTAEDYHESAIGTCQLADEAAEDDADDDAEDEQEQDADEEAQDDEQEMTESPQADLGEQHCLPNGPGSTQLRVRKHIFDMDFSLWLELKAAWIKLQKTGGYDEFAYEHTLHYKDSPNSNPEEFKDHKKQPGFLPFHRGQIQDLETKLQAMANNCDLTLPYWNWALDLSNFFTCDIWTDEYMGNKQGCVTSGLPKGWTYPFNSMNSGDCVERKLKDKGRNGLADLRELGSIIKGSKDYMTFCAKIEAVHNVAHGVIGGNMASKVGYASPSEPMFYLHHGFMDSLYYEWQKLNPDNAEVCQDAKGDICRESMSMWTGSWNKEENCVWLPIGRQATWTTHKKATCVSYAPAKNKGMPKAARMLGHVAAQCAALEEQILNGECSDDELKAIPCIDDDNCKMDLDQAEEEADEFDDAGKEDQEFDKTVHQMLEKLEEEEQCTSYVKARAVAETDMCISCDFTCTGASTPLASF